MSCTTVYGAFEDGNMVELGDCRNAWRGAMWIWSKTGDKHLNGFGYGKESEVWKLVDGDKLTDVEWYAMVSTFDAVLCPRDLMLTVADALERFEPGTENLARQGELIRKAHKDGARAIGWLQTSVCCSPWNLYEPCEDEDEESEARSYNIDTDEDMPLPEAGDKTAWWMEARPTDPHPTEQGG